MSDQSRRKLLKSIAAASGAVVAGKNLPEQWKKPVVDSVLLPVHAQTSARLFTGFGGTSTGSVETSNMLASLSDALVPEAKAGGREFMSYDYAGCVTEVNGGLDVWITYLEIPDLPELRELHGVIPASGGNLAELVTDCSGSGNSLYVFTAVSMTASSITLSPQGYPPVTLYLDNSCVDKLTFPDNLCPQQ